MEENLFTRRMRDIAQKRALQEEQNEAFEKLIFSPDQQEVIDLAMTGKNIFLTGKAGTGKTFVLKAIIHKLRYKNVAVLGTTGIAAMNAGGSTMHSFFRVPIVNEGFITEENCIFVNRDVRAMWDATDVVIIDEISMCRADQLDSIEWTLLKNRCESLTSKQIIFCGDLKQLPPVVKEGDQDDKTYADEYFYSAEICKELKIQEVELQMIHRQSDPEFIGHLNHLRDTGEIHPYFDQFCVDQPIGTVICPYKDTAIEHNRRELALIEAPRLVYRPTTEGNVTLAQLGIPDKIVLKHGAKVMHTVNFNGLVNGSIGILEVEEIDSQEVLSMWVGEGEERRKYRVPQYKFEKFTYELDEVSGRLRKKSVGFAMAYPLTLAYAMTIHKSQGLTFDELTVDLTRECFVQGQLYTALSRVRAPKGLNILV